MYVCIYIDYYCITTVNCTYEKSSAFEAASVTRALSLSRLSYFLTSYFDF
jgi:hypothetical protein